MVKTLLTRSRVAIIALGLVFIMVASTTTMAVTNGQILHYQYNQGSKQVTLTSTGIDIRVTTGGNVPHFMFWDPNITQANLRVIYHVQFYQLIEFNDTNDDGTYTPGTDQVVAPILGLASVDWIFSGFQIEEEDSIVKAVHFNFTSESVQGHHHPDLYIQLRCHVNITNANELKFDIVLSGWPWTYNDTYLALRWDLMVQSPGMLHYRHAYQYRYENGTYTFDGAYFAYKHSANVGNDTVQVTSCHEDMPEKTQFYIVYPNFGDDLLEHDPVIGLDETIIPPANLLPILIVIGAGALACVILAAAILVRQRRQLPTPPA